MKLFRCQHCGQQLDFENTRCERCGHVLGYLPEQQTLHALEAIDGQRWRPVAAPGETYRFCANASYDACNWLVYDLPGDHLPGNHWCLACRLNRTIPYLGSPENLVRWRRLEAAKHRLVYGLLRLRLPLANKIEEPVSGLAFDFLDAAIPSITDPVLTGHVAGVITINVAEADDAERERQRQAMHERYRTLLGHFRHESGHYYWERLVRDSHWLEQFRMTFGDERVDYAASIEHHYYQGPPPDWPDRFISAYASMHAWEDWAETWAHYLHLVDTLETAHAYGVTVANSLGDGPPALDQTFDPYGEQQIERLINAWLPLTFAMNGVNRSMGLPDLNPFVLSASVREKLRLVHEIVHAPRHAESGIRSDSMAG